MTRYPSSRPSSPLHSFALLYCLVRTCERRRTEREKKKSIRKACFRRCCRRVAAPCGERRDDTQPRRRRRHVGPKPILVNRHRPCPKIYFEVDGLACRRHTLLLWVTRRPEPVVEGESRSHPSPFIHTSTHSLKPRDSLPEFETFIPPAQLRFALLPCENL